MSFVTATNRAASPDLVNRRLVGGLLLSIVFHALLLSLQFGVPGLGLPSPVKSLPIHITIAPAQPAAPAVSAPSLEQLPPLPPAPAPMGMQLVAPPPAPAPPVVAKTRRQVKPRRISRPLPPPKPVESPTRVIAQDQNPNDNFAVPLPQPEEAVQKTADPKEAQEGSDDGAETRTAQVAEEKRKEELEAAAAKAEQETQARQAAARAEEQDRRQAALRQQQLDERAAQRQAEQLAARTRADEFARAQLAQDQLRQQQADLLVAKQKADELALKQKADEQALKQKAEELALKQKAEELALKQKAEELALKQKAEELALKQRAEELAARQRAEELARQQVAEAARQQAEQAARQQAEQAVRQQAEQAAAGQRERQRLAAAAPSAGAGTSGTGAGGTGVTVPKNMLGSEAGNRVRELTRGIDLLSGAPPQRARADDERGGRRVVVGSAERDVPLRMYVDSFRQKIERNGGLAFSPMASDRVRIDPLVSVALRSDGSVEDVTIVRSSGHTEIDNAVRRIVRVNARYSAFPPNIAARYDVIEIRRIWSFAESLKLLEELR
jgi:TolA protein